MTMTDIKTKLSNGGFWSSAGPLAFKILSALALLGVGFLLKGHVALEKDYAVHLQTPHSGVVGRLQEVDKRLLDHDRFHLAGKRFTSRDGDRLAEIMEESISACLEQNNRGLRASLSDIRAFRARLPQEDK